MKYSPTHINNPITVCITEACYCYCYLWLRDNIFLKIPMSGSREYAVCPFSLYFTVYWFTYSF